MVYPFLEKFWYNLVGLGNYTVSWEIEQTIEIAKEVVFQVDNSGKAEIAPCLDNLEEMLPHLRTL